MDDRTTNNPAEPTSESYMGAEGDTPDANTNFDPNLQGGPSAADQQATEAIEQQHTQSRSHMTGEGSGSDPARQMDNSGMLSPSGQGEDADIIGASGNDRNEDR